MAENKSMAQELLYAPQNGHVRIDASEEAACTQYCEGYKRFLDEGKTERECSCKKLYIYFEMRGRKSLYRMDK